MAREKKVIDASIIVKWFVTETGSNEALELQKAHSQGDCLLIIPELAFLEVFNALRYKNPHKDTLQNVNAQLWKLQLHTEKINEYLLEQGSRLAIDNDLTLYDAIYLALAQIHGCPLYTADRKFGRCNGVVLL